MKSIATAAKTIGDMFQGKVAYDANTFEAAAELIRASSGRTLLDDFPPGSLGERSQANETIWAQWDEFQILAGRLSILGAALAADADQIAGCDRQQHADAARHDDGWGQPARRTAKTFDRGGSGRLAGGARLSSDAGGLHELPCEVPDEEGLTDHEWCERRFLFPHLRGHGWWSLSLDHHQRARQGVWPDRRIGRAARVARAVSQAACPQDRLVFHGRAIRNDGAGAVGQEALCGAYRSHRCRKRRSNRNRGPSTR